MHKAVSAALLVLLPFLAFACSGNDSGGSANNPSGALRVVATTTQIGDFARNVGGDRISLTVLLKPNQDAHDFELEPSQIRAISEADVILRNGVGLDDFIDRALANSSAFVATISAGITLREGGHHNDHDDDDDHDHEHDDDHDDDHDHGDDHDHAHDPHIWFSVDNARRMVQNIRDALSAEDARNRDFYAANATAYLQELEALDGEIRAQVAEVPQSCRKLVSNHDVFGYFAAAYGFEVIGSVIPSTTSAAQASAAQVADIVIAIREENVPAIFGERSINPALINQVGREANVKVVPDLYGDSLGEQGSEGGTYAGMMRYNTTKIVEALRDCPA